MKGTTQVKDKFSTIYKKIAKTGLAIYSAAQLEMMQVQLAFASTGGLEAPEIHVNTDANATSIIGKFIGLLFSIFQLTGAVLAVYGLYQVIMGFKDDNPNSKITGVTFLIVGILVFNLQEIAQAVGLIG